MLNVVSNTHQLFSLSIIIPGVNAKLSNHTSTSLQKFCALPAKDQSQLCYVHHSIVCNMFPTKIKKLAPTTKKPDLQKIVAKTKQALVKIREEQTQHLPWRAKMIKIELQELSEPSIDSVDEFDSIGHDKGIQVSPLPNDLEEDTNSGFCLLSFGDMVKQSTKHPRSCSHSSKSPSSKDKSKDKSKDTSKEV